MWNGSQMRNRGPGAWPLHISRERDVRAADRDRDAVADILREQHVEGRLDADEFQDRLERCLAAKTHGELDQLLADLPVEHDRQAGAVAHARWRPIVVPLIVLAAIILSGGHLIWVAFPLFFFVVRPLPWRSVALSPGSRAAACGTARGFPAARGDLRL